MVHKTGASFVINCTKLGPVTGKLLVLMDGEKDHVHLLIHYPPKVAISALVNSLKGVSSRLLRKHHTDIHQYYWKGVLWSPSYFSSSCGGAPIAAIKKYIQEQNAPD